MPSLVAVACFLPGRAKDLSAPPRITQNQAMGVYIKKRYAQTWIHKERRWVTRCVLYHSTHISSGSEVYRKQFNLSSPEIRERPATVDRIHNRRQGVRRNFFLHGVTFYLFNATR